jgi:hypothetical protein
MKKLILILGILFVLRADAAMVRIVDVVDGRTLVIERNGNRETVQLAGVAILDEARAMDLLRWSVVSTWVMLEAHPGGGWLAFRSPDALFVNRELVVRGYARATEHGIEPERRLVVTYLGTIDPPLSATPPRTHSDTSPRSKAPRAPKTPRATSRRESSGRSGSTAKARR